MITPWDRDNTMDIDEVYVQLTLLRDNRKLAGTTKERLQVYSGLFASLGHGRPEIDFQDYQYSELFASHGRHLIPKRILVYGRPGIGKSTLTKKLAVDWSRGNKEILEKFAVVLLIKLRDVCNTQDFRAMLQNAELLSAGDPMVFSQLYDYILRNQQKILLILDGYDEYSAETSSPVHQIWKGSQLRDCTLLVTTRPRKKDELRPGSHAQFEIKGFDHWQVETFARKFLRDQTEVLKFTHFLYKHHLWDLAEIPLLLLMLVLSWKVSDYQGPSTSRADVYNSFCQTLLDHVTAKASDETFRSMDEYREELAKLGELAWQALLNDCLYFKLSNVPKDIRLFLDKFIDFGFLQTSNLSNSPRPEKLAFFLHKSVQEFLAALFLVRDFKNAKESFNRLSKVDSFVRFMELSEVFKFVSELSSQATVAVFRHLKMIGEKEGLTDFNFCENPVCGEKLTEEQGKFYSISLDLFLSCPSSDRKNVYPLFLQCINGVIVIDKYQLRKVSSEHCLRSTNFHDKPDYVLFKQGLTLDLGVVGDQMFSVMSDLDTVVVTCYGDVKSVNRYDDLCNGEFFIKKVGHRFVFCLTRPDFTFSTSPKIFEHLKSLISTPKSSLQEPDHVSKNDDVCSSLHLIEKTSDQTLTHSLSYLGEIKIEGPTCELVILLNNLHHVPRLSELFLHGAGMGNQECQLLATALKYVDKLRILMVSNNPLGHGISELANHLHSIPYLEELHLSRTQTGEEEVTALAHSLKNVTHLSELLLSKNPLGRGISELVKQLHFVPHLKELHLDDTQMGEEEVTALAHSLQNVTQLSKLELSNNPLGHGISELAKQLHFVPHLKELHLDDTQMGEEEVTALAHSLQNVTQLSKLELSNNPLGHGISELAKHLHSVPHLKQLYLNDTQMCEEEVTALVHVLVYVRKLMVLSLDDNPLDRGVTELIKCLRRSLSEVRVLSLRKVQLTKEEAIELYTLANERDIYEIWPLSPDYHERDFILRSDYHVSCSFVICIYFIFQLLMLVIPMNLLVDEKEPFFKGAVSPLLSILKKLIFVKENLSNSGPVVSDNNC